MARPDKAAAVAEIVGLVQRLHGRCADRVPRSHREAAAGPAATPSARTPLRRGQEHADQDRRQGGGRRRLRRPAHRSDRDRLHQGDVVEAAKGLRDFAKANPALVIKGGVLDGKSLDAAEIAKLADLESREVLLAQAGGRACSPRSARPSTCSTPRSRRPPGSPARCRRRPSRTRRSSGGAGDAGGPRCRGRCRTRPPRPPSPSRGRGAPTAAEDGHRGLTGPDVSTEPDNPPARRTRPAQQHGRKRHHGEAQHRRAARRVQGDDPHRALRVREAVRGHLRRHRRRPASPLPPPPPPVARAGAEAASSRTSSTSSSRPPATRRSTSSRRCAR